jgi:hypothetical protein
MSILVNKKTGGNTKIKIYPGVRIKISNRILPNELNIKSDEFLSFLFWHISTSLIIENILVK